MADTIKQTTPDYEKDLATLGDETKQKTMAGWGYKWQWSDKAQGIGGWTPVTEGAKTKFKEIYGEEYTGKLATLQRGESKLVAFGQQAYTGGLFAQGYNLPEANKIINENQQQDFAIKEKEQEPPVREEVEAKGETGLTVGEEQAISPYMNMFKEMMGGTEIPEAPSLVDLFKDEMTKYGIPELEQQINDYDKQLDDEYALMRERKDYEAGKPVALGVISGKQSEIEKQSMEKIDWINRQKNYAVNQLNTKYNMVNTIMNLTQTDFNNAMTVYTTKFSQAMDMIGFVKGVAKDYRDEKWREKTEEQRQKEREEDTARANLQVIYNQVTGGNIDYNDLNNETKTMISKLEIQSGFPVGFIQNLKNTNPEQDIISTSARTDQGGNKYADIIMRDKDGSISVQNILLGKEKVSGGGGGGGGSDNIDTTDSLNPLTFDEFIQQKSEQLQMSIFNPEQYRTEYEGIISNISSQMGGQIIQGKQEGFDFLDAVVANSPDATYEELYVLARTRTPDLSIKDIETFLKSKGYNPTKTNTSGNEQSSESTMSDEEFLKLLTGGG